MSDPATFFNFFSTIKITKGFKRSVIQDLQNNNYYFINNGVYEIFSLSYLHSFEEISARYNGELDQELLKWFNWAEDIEFGRFCEYQNEFPSMSNDWHYPGSISNAIIDLSSRQGGKLPFKRIFNELDQLGCHTIEFRIFEQKFSATLLELILNDCQSSEITGIEILIPYDLFSTQRFTKFNKVRRISVWGAFEAVKKQENGIRISMTTQKIDSEQCCGVISPNYFANNISMYTESLHHNSCLNRKISIDGNGLIKNCPSMGNDFGSIDDTSLLDVVNKEEFKSMWKINKDSIESCNVCEFRYMCTDCRAFLSEPFTSKPFKCRYNPYDAVWS